MEGPTSSAQAPASPPNAVLTVVLGVVAPGLGLLYAGRVRWALVAMALFFGVTVAVPALSLDDAERLAHLPAALRASAAAVFLGSIAASIFVAVTKRYGTKVHAWWWVGFVLVSWVGAGQLRTRVVADRLVLLAAVSDESMRPTLDVGALVVAQVRGFDARTLKTGDLVVMQPDESERAQGLPPRVGRVVGVAGEVVEVKNGRVTKDGVDSPIAACAADIAQRAPRSSCVVEELTGTPIVPGPFTFAVTTVPAQAVFVLPDDRTQSAAAQAHGAAGLVPVARIVGRAVLAR